MKRLEFEAHAELRIIERCLGIGLTYEETIARIVKTVKNKRISRKHRSKRHLTFYHYFPDNIAFYVICRERKSNYLVKTVIVEVGRQ